MNQQRIRAAIQKSSTLLELPWRPVPASAHAPRRCLAIGDPPTSRERFFAVLACHELLGDDGAILVESSAEPCIEPDQHGEVFERDLAAARQELLQVSFVNHGRLLGGLVSAREWLSNATRQRHALAMSFKENCRRMTAA